MADKGRPFTQLRLGMTHLLEQSGKGFSFPVPGLTTFAQFSS